MAVSYKKLFHLLVDRDMTAVQLQQQAGYSANITARLKRDTYISMESMEKICRVLDCRLDDIMDFVPDKPQGNKSED
ncbi:MAG: helix-turn-helix transcriptional regulator [Clostridia bacterium]|nr:helix-turn-helix transcriptional regulator [Clostridia bacterium]